MGYREGLAGEGVSRRRRAACRRMVDRSDLAVLERKAGKRFYPSRPRRSRPECSYQQQHALDGRRIERWELYEHCLLATCMLHTHHWVGQRRGTGGRGRGICTACGNVCLSVKRIAKWREGRRFLSHVFLVNRLLPSASIATNSRSQDCQTNGLTVCRGVSVTRPLRHLIATGQNA